MKYERTIKGTFIRRLNRFIAEVQAGEKTERVHVKNTGRLKELLVAGAEVGLEISSNPARKTKYSLVSVKKGDRWVNIDSQAPNAVVYDALMSGGIAELGPIRLLAREKAFGKSRFDLYYEGETEKGFMEVKGVTLEKDGVALFPDAPTARGTKHILELTEAAKEGYGAVLFFLVQMGGCRAFSPNREMDPPFAEALSKAAEEGVKILAYDAFVTEDEMVIGQPVRVMI